MIHSKHRCSDTLPLYAQRAAHYALPAHAQKKGSVNPKREVERATRTHIKGNFSPRFCGKSNKFGNKTEDKPSFYRRTRGKATENGDNGRRIDGNESDVQDGGFKRIADNFSPRFCGKLSRRRQGRNGERNFSPKTCGKHNSEHLLQRPNTMYL